MNLYGKYRYTFNCDMVFNSIHRHKSHSHAIPYNTGKICLQNIVNVLYIDCVHCIKGVYTTHVMDEIAVVGYSTGSVMLCYDASHVTSYSR